MRLRVPITLMIPLLSVLGSGCQPSVDVLGSPAVSGNTPPTRPQVEIVPAAPISGDALAVQLLAASWDADGDDVDYEITWSRDGAPQGTGQEVAAGTASAGELWSVRVVPTDGVHEGPAAGHAVVVASAPEDDLDGDGFTVEQGDCDDADADIHPGAGEDCDGVDDDCDGDVDEGCGGECGDGLWAGPCEECDGADDGACPGLCSAHCACPAASPGTLEIHAVDVDQGDAFVVVSPDGFVMAVDAGKDSQFDELQAYLDAAGIDELDYTLVSHMHEDHLGGMDELLEDHPEAVARFDHGRYYDTNAYQSYAYEAGECRWTVNFDDELDLGPAVQVDVLHSWTGMDNENLNSVVVRLAYGDVSVLLGGDCESDGCEDHFDPGPIDVYKVHHHGSDDSSSTALLQQMQPRVALIPVGSNNSYGHPHTTVLNRLEDVGADIYRTDVHGDTLVTTDGDQLWVDGVAVE